MRKHSQPDMQGWQVFHVEIRQKYDVVLGWYPIIGHIWKSNNVRIDQDRPTRPLNSNKCLMLDVFVVFHILSVHRVSPTTSTVQGVSSSFIPTENGDERLDCACSVENITGLTLNVPWLDAGEQGCSGTGHYPGKSVSIRLEQISRSVTCFEFFPTAKKHLSLRNTDCCRIECFEKRTLRTSFPKPSRLLLQTNMVAFSSTHMTLKCGWRAGEK